MVSKVRNLAFLSLEDREDPEKNNVFVLTLCFYFKLTNKETMQGLHFPAFNNYINARTIN
jgi:hypothetical protein